MATPSRPVRKSTQVGVGKLGTPVPGPNKSTYQRQSVAPFSNPGKGAYKRQAAPISASGTPVNDKDAGNNVYRAKGNNPKDSSWKPGQGRAGQPFNNPGVKRGSRTMKGVD